MTAPACTILEAMDDAALFAGLFAATTWKPWRTFLAGLFALPMDAEALALYQAHTARSTAPDVAFREACLIIGRRGGKSRTLALIAVFLACFRDYTPHLAPGEMATIAIIAADRRQARSIFRFIQGLLQAVPMLAEMIEAETAETLTLTNRVQIEIATASFRVTRGYTFAAVLADEAAFWRDESGANPDAEIIAAVRPGLATIPGSMLLIASSPYRKGGIVWKSYRDGYGKDGARILVWKAATLEMNPSLDPAIVAEAYADDPESASAEYGGEFRNDLAPYVDRVVVDACTAPGRYELPRISTNRYSAFTDPSGGSADSFTLAIVHAEKDRVVLDAVRERKPPFSPESVVEEYAALLKSYGISRVSGDRYADEWPREQFRKYGIQYDLSEKNKSDIYRDMLPVLNAGAVELLDIPRLATQLCNLERRTARGGRDSIDHAPGAHDDLANCVAGAVLLVKSARPPMKISPEALAWAAKPCPTYGIGRWAPLGGRR
jgi:hypothetical protein